MIRLEDVTKWYDGRAVLDHVSLHLEPGMLWGLIGPAASGKSVLLKVVCGLIRPDEGRVIVDQRDITKDKESDIMETRRKFGMLFQNNALFDFMTVGENVAFPIYWGSDIEPDRLRSLSVKRLQDVGLSGSEDKVPSELSGGMKKRVGIARATIADPKIVIYDEPTAGLDPVTTSKIYDLLRNLQQRNESTVLAVSSDVQAIRGFVEHIAVIHQGRILYNGPERELDSCADPVVHQFIRGDADGPL
ncbi:MAG: ATP-binding cassette domain-containing protein [Deltaproteobacteria bacterium]|nr:ATP-binding cassette domain-containing protein [Deltaproteobacteria bacterium]